MIFFDRRGFSVARWSWIAASLAWLLAVTADAALAPVSGFPITGRYSLAVDGGGDRNAAYELTVEVPDGAVTVHRAYLFAATYGGRTLADGDVLLDGNALVWTAQTPALGGQHVNYLAEVTAIVDAALGDLETASGGTLSLTVEELGPDTDEAGIDGTVLVVVFNNPSLGADRMIALFRGAQATGADTFTVTYPGAIPPNGTADFGVGISHSVQSGSTNQYTRIDVNGSRLTTAAGGQDDGAAVDGALVTVGGYGDANDNPLDPTGLPTGDPRADDEAYSLLPIIASTVNASTPVSVTTVNPSGDDNLFLAWFVFSAEPVLGEVALLTPNQSTNQVGTSHTVTVTVTDANGEPAGGRFVFFEVIGGPNSGLASELLTTGEGGQAEWTYTDTSGTGGTDQIQATFLNSDDELQTSNVAIKIWVEGSVEATQFVLLDPGWNLVFIRVDAFETNPDVLFGPGSLTFRLVKVKAAGTTYSYDYSYARLQGEGTFAGGETFWIFEPGATARTVQIDGVTSGVTQMAVSRAWNTIGVHQRTTVPAATGFIAAYSWNAVANAYLAAAVDPITGRTILEGERGYFVFAIRPVSFTIRP